MHHIQQFGLQEDILSPIIYFCAQNSKGIESSKVSGFCLQRWSWQSPSYWSRFLWWPFTFPHFFSISVLLWFFWMDLGTWLVFSSLHLTHHVETWFVFFSVFFYGLYDGIHHYLSPPFRIICLDFFPSIVHKQIQGSGWKTTKAIANFRDHILNLRNLFIELYDWNPHQKLLSLRFVWCVLHYIPKIPDPSLD